MDNIILCVKWGDKYGREYVEKLKQQCEENCSVPFNFYCLTDNPTEPYDILLPTTWDSYENGKFWAYRKLYMFKEAHLEIRGKNFLYLDLDVIIHQDLKYFFELSMERPWIVRGWWNDINECRKNYAAMKSTPINSSVIRWNRGQLVKVYDHIQKNLEVLFFTYPTIDNYLNHFWYHMWYEDLPAEELEKKTDFNIFEPGIIYSYYRGNTWPDDVEQKKLRLDQKICLFNNSAETNDVEELKLLW